MRDFGPWRFDSPGLPSCLQCTQWLHRHACRRARIICCVCPVGRREYLRAETHANIITVYSEDNWVDFGNQIAAARNHAHSAIADDICVLYFRCLLPCVQCYTHLAPVVVFDICVCVAGWQRDFSYWLSSYATASFIAFSTMSSRLFQTFLPLGLKLTLLYERIPLLPVP